MIFSLICKPSAIPLTKEVLPAPIFPLSKIIDLASNSCEKLCPNLIVSSKFLSHTNLTKNHLEFNK